MAENFLDKELSDDPIGGPALVTTTRDEDERRAEEQSWYNTLGIGGDENTETLVDGVKDTFFSGGNFAYDIYADVRRMYDNTPDPEFNAQQYTLDNQQINQIDDQYLGAFSRTSSLGEWSDLLADVREREEDRKRIQRMGITGQLTSGIIAGIADIDTLASGGFSLIGKGGIMATRMGKIMAGTASGTLTATAGAAASPEDDWANVAVAALFSAGVATGATSLSGRINKSLDNAVDELDVHLENRLETGRDGPQAAPESVTAPWHGPDVKARQEANVESVQPKVEGEEDAAKADEVVDDTQNADVANDRYTKQLGSSAGAAQVQSSKIQLPTLDYTVVDIQNYAKSVDKANRLDELVSDNYSHVKNPNPVQDKFAKVAKQTTAVLGKLGLNTDYDTWMRSKSSTARAFAFLSMRDAAGRGVNNANAASFKETFEDELFSKWRPTYLDAKREYTKSLGHNKWFGLQSPKQRRAAEEEFNRMVYIEQENKRLNGAYSANIHPNVKQVADAMDEWSLTDHRIGVGDGLTTDLPGYIEFDPQRGYAPRPMSSARVFRHMQQSAKDYNAGRTNRQYQYKDYEDMFTGYYTTSLGARHARLAAKMLMKANENKYEGLTMDLTGLYNSVKPDDFIAMAVNAGISKSQANDLVKRIKDYGAYRMQQAHTKTRIEGDIRYVHPNGLKIIDFVDTDLHKVLSARTRNVAGRAALARGVGIRTADDMKAWKQAILREQAEDVTEWERTTFPGGSLVDKLKEGARDAVSFVNEKLATGRFISADDIDDKFAQFTGGAIRDDKMAGTIMRAKRLSGLSALGGSGLWQVAETSNLVGAAGWQDFIRNLPAAMRKDLTNPRSELVQELRVFGKFIPEERMHDPYYVSELGQTLSSQSEMTYWIDRIMARGTNMQGMINGMFKVKEWQHNLSTFVVVDKLLRSVAGKEGGFSEARLLQMGASPQFIKDLKAVSQHVTWDADGTSVVKLNIDNWKNGDLEYRFLNTLNAFTDQQVQKTIAGETNSVLAGNGVVSLFTQFLNYPINALNKQFARQAYAGDTEALFTAMYGFLFGGTVGLAKTAMSGKWEDLDMENFAKSGFQNANLTGWAPMLADPLMSLVGLEDYRFNQFGGIVRTPPAVGVLNSVALAPKSIAGIILGDRSAENIRNARMLPIIGNLPPWTALLNGIKE